MEKTKLPRLRQLVVFGSATSPTIAIKALVIPIIIVVLYYQDLSLIFNDAIQSEATSHMLVIPFLLGYLLYRKRKMIRAVVPLETANQPKNTKHLATLSGIILCAMTIVFYWYGSYTFTPIEYHILTVPIFVAGLTLILFNAETLRQIAFPIALLIFLVPPPSEILYRFGSTLSVVSSEVSNIVVSIIGIPATISSEYGNPTIIITRPDTTTLNFTVDLACSGIYSLIGFFLFAAFLAYIARDKAWKKTAILLVGIPLIYFLNIIRISTILIIGYNFGEQIALEVFHTIGGWVLIFLGTLLLLITAEKLLKTKVFAKPLDPTSCQKCSSPQLDSSRDHCSDCGRLLRYPRIKLRKRDVVKIASIAITIVFLLTIQAPLLTLTKGPTEVIIQTPEGEQGNTQILPQIQGYNLQFVYRDKDFEQLAKQDASLIYAYRSSDKKKEDVWAAIEIASTRSALHRWEYCLVTRAQTYGYEPGAEQLDLRDIQILQNPPMIARYFAFQYPKYNQTQVVLYWYETSTFVMNSTAQKKLVKISLIMYPQTAQDVPEAENQTLPIASAIVNYRQPIETWTKLTLILSQNGLALTLATAILLTSVVIFYVIEKMRIQKANTNTYKKLSNTYQRIIAAVLQTQQHTVPTLKEIAKTYQSRTSENIDKETLLQQLTEAEKTGLVGKQIINNQDEPIQTWKTRLTFPSKNVRGRMQNSKT